VALTPQDIVRKEFREAFRGYNQTDVDLFLDELVEELTRLADENQKMRVRLAALQQELGRFRDSRSSRATQQMASRYAELAPDDPRARADDGARSETPRMEAPRTEAPRPEPRIEPLRQEPPREPWPSSRSEPPRPSMPSATPTPPPPARAPDPASKPDRADPFGSRIERPPVAPASDPFRSDQAPPAPPVASAPAPAAPAPDPKPEPHTEPHRPVTERWTPPEESGSFWDRER